MAQLSVTDQPAIARGSIITASSNIITNHSLNGISVAQVVQYSVAASPGTTAHKIKINGVESVTTPSSGDTQQVISAAIVSVINADAEQKKIVTASVDSTDDTKLNITANEAGRAFSYSEDGAKGSMALTVSSANRTFSKPGLMLSHGLNNEVQLPSSASERVAGVLGAHSGELNNKNNVLQYEDGTTVAVISSAIVGVLVEESVTPESDVYYRFKESADGSRTTLGAFRTDSDGSTCAQLATGAVYLSTTSANGTAKLRILIP